MKTKRLTCLTALGVLALAGCLTQQQLIERRIGEKAGFFAALPAESQQRLRAGKLEAGDSQDAAWIVYGRPDRVFQKATAAATNEVWSYVTQEFTAGDEARPVSHPIRTSRGWWSTDTLWAPSPSLDRYEYLRIEFEGGRVLSVQSEAPLPAAR
jgi:hypothetical protein